MENRIERIENSYCDICCRAAINAWKELMELSPSEAMQIVKYGKIDTMSLDAAPEIIINKRLSGYDPHCILVTEELGKSAKKNWPTDSTPIKQPLMFFSDPTDRSKYLKKFIEKISDFDKDTPIGKLMKEKEGINEWEKIGEEPASITGATSAITCVRKGEIVFSVILNYITRTIFVASSGNIKSFQLPEYDDNHLEDIDFTQIVKNGKHLNFPPVRNTCFTPEDRKRFVTFLGKTGYLENFKASMIFLNDPLDFTHHKEPGGPARILYLSELQKGFGSIGFILANGEKITEWIHWLAFAKFAKNHEGAPSLKVFEISIERPLTKEGILMSTSPPYSIFCSEEIPFVDISRLGKFDNPSRFRSMLVVVPEDNEKICRTMIQHDYRDVSSFF
jgi:hypothetical protein